MKTTIIGFIVVLNAVDDQLYLVTNVSLKEWFEKATKKRFDVQLIGQATWYLQPCIAQLTDYSIVLDQSRFAALIVERYLSIIPESDISTQMRQR
jgi:penicillin-binding protein-related factor A (putative recombinase)